MSLAGAVDQVCRDLIGPTALFTDADVVPRSHLDALAATGLLGAAVDDAVASCEVRAAHERLAGACLSTWFVLAQHQTPLRLLAAAPQSIRGPLLPLLSSGTTIAGIAFSHLRRWPHRPVEVERCGEAWEFRGVAPWYTGWGINDVAVIAGASARGDAVFALAPAQAAPRLRPGPPLDTVALAAARTVTLHLEGLIVPDDGVLAVRPVVDWQRADRAAAANVSPSVLGVTQSAVDRLAACPDPAGQDAAERLRERLQAIRIEAYGLIDDVDPQHELGRRLELRADALRLCLDATSALVVAGAGRSMLRSDHAQLLARWAMFLTVQAQTAELRTALLRRLVG